MAAEQGQERRDPPGWISASPERPAQRLAAPLLSFDLEREVRQLRRAPS